MLNWPALLSYMAVMYITPGPNNIMVTASGVNFGFVRTLPHIAGVCVGVALQLFLCALLLDVAAGGIATVRKPLAFVGCAYLLWLSYKLLRSAAPGEASVRKPMSFAAGALFQCVNPKAWVMVMNTAVLFMPSDGHFFSAGALALASVAVGIPSLSLWSWSGDGLRRALLRPRVLRVFNICMSGALAATSVWLLLDELRQP